ncbi:MAG: hypothetical protein AAGH46_08385 [Bacteroidota bacterium]
MKKLLALKSIVDFIWIICCIPMALIMLLLLIISFVNADTLNEISVISFVGLEGSRSVVIFRILVLSVIVGFALYCFFLFRRVLRFFMKAQPFHTGVISTFRRIGKILVWLGIAGLFFSFIEKLLIYNRLVFNVGFWPYLFMSALGLFFQVLAEIFVVAKLAKEENQLTI